MLNYFKVMNPFYYCPKLCNFLLYIKRKYIMLPRFHDPEQNIAEEYAL